MKAEAIQRYLRRVEERRTAEIPRPRYSIAMSREAFSLGTSTCRELERQLGWPVYGHDILEAVANDMKVRSEVIDALDEEAHHWIRELLRNFQGQPTQNAFVAHLHKVIGALGREGGAIFLGRGAVALLPRDVCLRVRIIANMDVRKQRCVERLGITRAEAQKKIEQTDQQRRAFVRDFFHADLTDPHLFDLVLNSTSLTPKEMAPIILSVARHRWADFPTGGTTTS